MALNRAKAARKGHLGKGAALMGRIDRSIAATRFLQRYFLYGAAMTLYQVESNALSCAKRCVRLSHHT